MCKRIFNNQTAHVGDIPFYKIGSFGKKADAFISKELYLDYKNKFPYPKKGDILISAAGTIGRTVIYNGEDAYYQDSNIVWINNNNMKVLNSFLYYVLHIVKYNTEGGTIQRLYNNILKATSFYTPEIKEQQKIASFLTAVDKRIQLLQKKKTCLEEYKKGVMQQIFSQKIRFKDDNGNDFPEWKKKRLGEVFSSKKGKGLSKNVINPEGQFKCILYGELYTNYNEVIFNIINKTNAKEGTLSKIGDLLVPCSTTTTAIDLANVTALNKGNVRLGGDITILRGRKQINNIFYAYYFSNYKKYEIAKFGQGTTIVHLYYNHFKVLKIDVPSLKEQMKIASFLSSLDTQIESVGVEIENTMIYKKGLLQKMFV